MPSSSTPRNQPAPRFVDVFAGCGGLSLGLANAGWTGLFAVEKHADAFSTLRDNLVTGSRASFAWPSWLPVEAISTANLLAGYRERLGALSNKVDLMVGGPPCQGFSTAGRRKPTDPRNALFRDYLDLVSTLSPQILVVENVRGFTLPFVANREDGGETRAYSVLLDDALTACGYEVHSELVDLSAYGVPQRRTRFILIAIRKGSRAETALQGESPFGRLRTERVAFLAERGLPTDRPVSVKDAIDDLQATTSGTKSVHHAGGGMFEEIIYERVPGNMSAYASLMRKGNAVGDSLRLANHRPKTIERFRQIMETCRRGRSLSDADRERLNIKKHSVTPLAADQPSVTVTTLPDDMLHYAEPRILSVRENARLQSFPDWYSFKGKYTTGAHKRKDDCPRYTQVGNAVPPLFSEAVGAMLHNLLKPPAGAPGSVARRKPRRNPAACD